MKKTRGFILLDLLAVVPLILILALALVPFVQKARENARRTVCLGHLSQLGRAFAQYLNEYGGYIPAKEGVLEFGWGKGKSWMDQLFRYVDADPDGRGPSYPGSTESKRTEVFRCPSIKTSALDGRKYLTSYILNSRLYLDSPGGVFDMAKVRNPGTLVVLYDRNKWTGDPTDADPTDEWANNGGPDGYGPGGLWNSNAGGPDFSGPHSGGYNILFADYHVRWFGRWVKGMMTRHADQEPMDRPSAEPRTLQAK